MEWNERRRGRLELAAIFRFDLGLMPLARAFLPLTEEGYFLCDWADGPEFVRSP